MDDGNNDGSNSNGGVEEDGEGDNDGDGGDTDNGADEDDQQAGLMTIPRATRGGRPRRDSNTGTN